MRNNVESILKEVENEIKALKSVYAISGSLVEFHVTKSNSVFVTDTATSTKLSVTITFTPDKDLDQNKFSDMYMLAEISTNDGTNIIKLPNGSTYGTWDEDGKLSATFELTHSPGTQVNFIYSITAYAIVSGPATGTFTYDTSVT